MLYNIFKEFLEDVNEDVLPNDRTGYLDSLVWQKLFNFQRDAATGLINKLETYNGCILADSVGLGKTFTALAVIKYYELRNKSVLVLCPKKLADNWLNYNRNLKTNLFARDRFNYDVLCHTDLSRTRGESLAFRWIASIGATTTWWSSTSRTTSATTTSTRTGKPAING
jgi:SNF2 family DNA or RNA helicase